MDGTEMSLTRQLYQLQEVDLELESNEQAIKEITSQLGESEAVAEVRNKLEAENEQLKESAKEQRSLELEIDGVASKLATVEKDMYSGKIGNPKELTDLQHEADGLKTRRNKMEDQALEKMEQSESTRKGIATLDSELKEMEKEWQSQQEQLSAELEEHNKAVAELNKKREAICADIDSETIEIYQELRKQRGTAVAKVEQGMCLGCRISLPVTELQRVRSGGVVRCSSCGRILFLA